ncbi:MAG: PAS domain S-box protein, partial [Blastocatellia bacterium]
MFNAVNCAVFVLDADSCEILDANLSACNLYGYSLEEMKKLSFGALSAGEPPYTNDEAVRQIIKATEEDAQIFEWEARDKSGNLFWVEVFATLTVIESNDSLLAVVRDITRRRHTQEALRESEQRFETLADTAPAMMWVSGPDKMATYLNHQWLKFTGRTIEQEIGDGWLAGVHSDDVGKLLETREAVFDSCEPFTVEYRLRRANGDFRWVYCSGAPRYSPGGKFLGHVGTCVDITERKMAEEAIANLSRQLIRAREEECARIARDLHDDLNQRMALVSVELEQLVENPPETREILVKHLRGVISQAAEISRGIHRISYDLHP